MSDLTYKQIFAKEIGLMFKHGLKEKRPMKKYAIIIGEGNKELSERVQRALFAVGFEWAFNRNNIANLDDYVIYIQSGEMSGSGRCFPINDFELLWPSYVLEHASELDGAKKVKPLPKLTMKQACAAMGYDFELVKES